MKNVLIFLIILFFSFNVYSLDSNFTNKLNSNYVDFPTPITVPSYHPRVYLTPEKVLDIKNRLQTDQNMIDLWNNLKSNNNAVRVKGLAIYDKILNQSEMDNIFLQGIEYNHFGNTNLSYYHKYLIGDLNITNFPQNKGSMSFWIYLYTPRFTKNSNLIDAYKPGRKHIFVRAYSDINNKSNIQIAFQNTTGPYVFHKNLDLPINSWQNLVVTWDTINDNANIFLNTNVISSSQIKDPNWTPDNQTINRLSLSSGDILVQALKYLLDDDDEACNQIIQDDLNKLKAEIDARVIESQAHFSAMVYDWCYPFINSNIKQDYINEFIRIANLHSPWYPANPETNSVVGHAQEGWLLTFQIPAGLAIYDENKTMFDAASKLFFDRYVEVRNYFYPGHFYHQGDGYFGRFVYDQLATHLYKNIGYADVLSREQQFVPYAMLYQLRPDLFPIRNGDSGAYNGGRKNGIYSLTSSYYNDSYLHTIYSNDYLIKNQIYYIFRLLFQKNFENKSLDDLPISKYFKEPAGEMIARTGWELDNKNSKDSLTFMRIGGTYFGNHQKRDFGTFQMYYKGILALRSGIYGGTDINGNLSQYGSDHWKNYAHQTLSHNGLLIYDPSELLPSAARKVNSGGQWIPNNGATHPPSLDSLQNDDYEMGEVLAYDIKPNDMNPEFSYISGDITNAYYPNKTNLVKRSMITFNLNSTKFPQSLVVFDIINSTNASFNKTWLIHSIEEPMISGNEIEIKRTQDGYNGRLNVKTFLPKQFKYEKIGGPGFEFWVKETNTNYLVIAPGELEGGAWRVELSPLEENNLDYFLNVLTVSDASETTNPQMSLLENDDLLGVNVKDRVILFSKNKDFLNSLNFNLSLTGTYKILFCDLNSGMWKIKKNGQIIYDYFRVEKDSKCAYFENENGFYELTRVNSNIIKNLNDDEVFWNKLRYLNEPPEIIKPPLQKINESEIIIFDINFTDPDLDTFSAQIYNEDGSLNTDISIDSISNDKVKLSWSPTQNDVGINTFYIVIEDGYYISEDIFSVEVLEINSSQINNTTKQPPDDNSGSSGSSGGSGSTTFSVEKIDNITITEVCIPNYFYNNWSVCLEGKQTQFIEDLNNCEGDFVEERICEEGLTEEQNLLLNAKLLNLTKTDYKKYISNLNSDYNEIFYVENKLEYSIFLLKDNNTNGEYFGQYFDTIDDRYYYTLKRVDEGIMTILQDEGILDLPIKNKKSNLTIIMFVTLFSVIIFLFFVYILHKKRLFFND